MGHISISFADHQPLRRRSQSETNILDHVRHSLVSIRQEMAMGTPVDPGVIDRLEMDFAAAENDAINTLRPEPDQ